MAKIGYIYKADVRGGYEDSEKWMNEYGCCRIASDDSEDLYTTRPAWRTMLSCLGRGDELVLSRFSNALRSCDELAALVELCRVKGIRLISIGDKIDTGGSLFPATTVNDVLLTIGTLPSEIVAMRDAADHLRMLMAGTATARTSNRHRKEDRDKLIVSMYKNGEPLSDILTASGFSSPASIFRIIKKYGVELNRGKGKGQRGQDKKAADAPASGENE